MKNPSSLSDKQLKTLLDGFSAWYQNNPEEINYATKQKEEAEKLGQTLLNKKYLSAVSDSDLITEVIRYSRTLEGPAYIRLGEPRISREINRLKANFAYLIDSPDGPFKKAGEILKGKYKIPFFAKAFWSPIFLAFYPDTLPNWNNKTERFLEKIGIDVKSSKYSSQEQYKLISDAFLYFKELDSSLDFYHINHLMHYGTVIPEGVALLDSIIGRKEIRYWQIAPGKKAKLWEDLHSNSIAAVGFSKLDLDLSEYSEKDLSGVFKEYYTDYSDQRQKFDFRQLWNFVNLRPGDRFVTSKGQSRLLGLGEIKSGYKYRPEREEYKHTVDVEYYNVSENGIPIPSQLKGKFGKTIVRLEKSEFETLQSLFNGNGNEPYPLSKCAEETGFEESLLERWVRAIERKGQAVLYGPPGTGKTFVAEHLAKHLVGGGYGFIDLVQFHPAYAYEDFIQGIRPKVNEEGTLDYPVVEGRFIEFCKKAADREGRCILIIDEINRSNLARVFGELMYLLEYRDKEVPLASGGILRIPENVLIIGTMNTADRSIALVDHALRRRFAFLALYPNYNILQEFHKKTQFNVEPLIAVLRKLNQQIGDQHYEVGISFFLRQDLQEQIEDIWRTEIEPYLEEYFFDQRDKAEAYRWDKIGKEILF